MSKVNVLIYKITGKQLFFTIPTRVCEERDLTVNLVNKVANEIKNDKLKIEVGPWLWNIITAFSKGALHPPILLINGHVFSQGTVPNEKRLGKHYLMNRKNKRISMASLIIQTSRED